MKKIVLLFFLLFFIGCTSFVSQKKNVQNTNKFQKERTLFALIDKRLSLMKDVALYKWKNKIPIEDIKREKIVIKKAIIEGRVQGLCTDKVHKFFEIQITLAKTIQRKWHLKWSKEKRPSLIKIVDLKKEIRPEIIRLGKMLIKSLKEIHDHVYTEHDQKILKEIIKDTLKGLHLDHVSHEKILQSVLLKCS